MQVEETDEEHQSEQENTQNDMEEENANQPTVGEEFTQIWDQESASGEDSEDDYDKTNDGYFLDL